MNPIEKIQFEKEYKSSPKAWTDIHAGGLFFCVPYEEIVKFHKGGKVEITKRVIENFRPCWGQRQIDKINNFKLIGTYKLSGREYVECTFEGLSMIGLPLEINYNIIAFHCSGFKDSQYGTTYKLSN
tara:strand:+ start:937 stop:1317 length:381 start_codon:yes stop_codon:yes gene_type:complete